MFRSEVLHWVECDWCGAWTDPVDGEDVDWFAKDQGWDLGKKMDLCPECKIEVEEMGSGPSQLSQTLGKYGRYFRDRVFRSWGKFLGRIQGECT